MSFTDYQLSTITKYRAGTIEDPYIDVTQSDVVNQQRIVLNEIPTFLNKLQISGLVEVFEVDTADLTSTQFRVDYNEGLVFFHSSLEGITKTILYKGRGNHYISATRVYTKNSGDDITQTLDQVVTAASNFAYIGEYNPSTLYKTYNMVRYQGSFYMYTAITSASGHLPSDSAYFTKVAGSTNKGVYSTSISYASGDIVENSAFQKVYQSLIDGNLNQPLSDTSKWQLLIDVSNEVNTLVTTNTNVNNDETSRVSAESTRVTNEGNRTGQETSRQTAESNRVSAETTRVGNESTRQSQESTRQSQETTRQTNTTNAINSLNTAVSDVIHKGAYNASTSYVKNNSVSLIGNTWRCLQSTTGNSPIEGIYWTLEAAKGADGAGAGDMIKSTYDTNSDGKVNSADSADAVPWSGITGKPTSFGKTASTFVVGASNSKDTSRADYICTGTNDQTVINNALTALPLITWETGTATAGAASTLTLPTSRAGNGDGWYIGYQITITSGTGVGQTKYVIGYIASTNIITVDSTWTTIPDATSVYALKSQSGRVILLEGLYSIAGAVNVPTNCTLEGQGDGTILQIPNAKNTSISMIQNADTVSARGSSHIRIYNLRLEGNKGNNTAGTQHGIVITRSSYCSVQQCTVNGMRNTGITFQTLGGDFARFNLCTDNTVIGCNIGISAGTSYSVFSRNSSRQNTSVGFSSSTLTGIIISENIASNNLSGGIYFTTMTSSKISDNICNENLGVSSSGISLSSNSNNNTIIGNTCHGNGAHGIQLSTSSNNVVSANSCLENSQQTSATSDNIFIDGTSNTNNVQGNICRQGAQTNLPRYGIRVNASTCTGNLVTNNDLTTGGTTGAFSDLGTGTITTSGNKLA